MIEVKNNLACPQVFPLNSKYENFTLYEIVDCRHYSTFKVGDIVFFASSPGGERLVINANQQQAYTVGRFVGDSADIRVKLADATVVIK
jgi:hypothetical protein